MPAFLAWFLSPIGLLVLSALDATVVVFLPLALDVVVIYLAAGDDERFWMYPFIATAGSLAGSALTYWIGRRVGEPGLARWVSEGRLKKIQQKVKHAGAFAIAATAFIPPPFPFTAFLLASGALRVHRVKFFASLAAVRVMRFGAEAVLAHLYGKRLVSWMESEPFRIVVWVFVAIALAGTAWTVYALLRKTRRGRPAQSGGESGVSAPRGPRQAPASPQ